MSESEPKEQHKKVALFNYGMSGHENEFVITLHKNRYSAAEDIPRELEELIEEKLGEGYSVMSRGARIEIMPPGLKINEEIQKTVHDAIADVLGEDYELRG
jgi:hydroxymethylpyrimidine pyrophosphatase-like HAD family hydrolase